MTGVTPAPRLAADACSVQWDDAELPSWGTAARAAFWVGLEQDGPWGAKALVESHLSPGLGADLERVCAEAGGRLLLIRPVGHHAITSPDAARTVLVAGGEPDERWLVRATVTDPRILLELPVDALTEGAVIDLLGGARESAPQLLVCTNGKRDLCCATRGRPLAQAAAAQRPGQVWECTHTGGHRFSPTGIMLPSGQTLGRLDADTAVHALDEAAAGRLAHGPVVDRGMAHLDPVVQAAEAFVRHERGLHTPLRTGEPIADGPGVVVPVEAAGGTVRVRVERRLTGDERKDSCAKAAVPSSVWQVSTC